MNKIRKEASDVEVQKAAIEVLSKWKEVMVPSATGAAVKRPVEAEDETEKKSKTEMKVEEDSKPESKEVKETTEAKPKSKEANEAKTETVEVKTTNNVMKTEQKQDLQYLKDYLTGDAVRDKCLEMFVNALNADNPTETPDELILSAAQGIEHSLFSEFSGVTPAYKTKFRSKYLNLKDPKNPTLREALISGMINSDRFIAMTVAVSF